MRFQSASGFPDGYSDVKRMAFQALCQPNDEYRRRPTLPSSSRLRDSGWHCVCRASGEDHVDRPSRLPIGKPLNNDPRTSAIVITSASELGRFGFLRAWVSEAMEVASLPGAIRLCSSWTGRICVSKAVLQWNRRQGPSVVVQNTGCRLQTGYWSGQPPEFDPWR